METNPVSGHSSSGVQQLVEGVGRAVGTAVAPLASRMAWIVFGASIFVIASLGGLVAFVVNTSIGPIGDRISDAREDLGARIDRVEQTLVAELDRRLVVQASMLRTEFQQMREHVSRHSFAVEAEKTVLANITVDGRHVTFPIAVNKASLAQIIARTGQFDRFFGSLPQKAVLDLASTEMQYVVALPTDQAIEAAGGVLPSGLAWPVIAVSGMSDTATLDHVLALTSDCFSRIDASGIAVALEPIRDKAILAVNGIACPINHVVLPPPKP